MKLNLNNFFNFTEHEWVSFRDLNYIRSQGMTAGYFKRNIPAYIGQGLNSRGYYVPGRIQLENPKALFYTDNMKTQKTTSSVEFLRKNKELNYAWVEANARQCISNAVIVEGGNFYIGRTKVGNFSFIGQVQIGERGLKYENQQGEEILTDKYEVLTCSQISKQNLLVEVRTKLETCETNEKALKDENSILNFEVRKLKKENQNLELIKEAVTSNNDLLKEKIKRLEETGSNCNIPEIDDYDTIDVRSSTPTTQNCASYAKDYDNQLNVSTQNINKLTETNRKIEQELANAKMESENYKRQLETKNNEIETFRVQINELRRQLLAVTPCDGVDGCIHALSSVTTLNEPEQFRVLMLIKSKMPNKD